MPYRTKKHAIKDKKYFIAIVVWALIVIGIVVELNVLISKQNYKELSDWEVLIPVLESADQDLEWVQKTKTKYNVWLFKNKEDLDKFGWVSFVPEKVKDMDILMVGNKE